MVMTTASRPGILFFGAPLHCNGYRDSRKTPEIARHPNVNRRKSPLNDMVGLCYFDARVSG